MFRFLLALVCALCLASVASAQCNVGRSDTASAAAAVQNAQIQALVSQLSAQPQGATASAFAGNAANPQVAQLQALLLAQQRAATASALSLPSVQPLCTDGSCGASRVRAASRSVTRPVIQRPQRSRSVARSFSRA